MQDAQEAILGYYYLGRPWTVSMSCVGGRYRAYHERDGDVLEDLLYFMGMEEIFEVAPGASRRSSFVDWPFLSVFWKCRPVWDMIRCVFIPKPRCCLNFGFVCRVESEETGENYRMFHDDDELTAGA